MSYTGKVSHLCKLAYGDGASPEGFTVIPGTADLEIPGHVLQALKLSSTDQASAGFEPGKPEVTPISGTLNFDPDNAPQVQLKADILARTKRNFEITLTDTSPDSTFTFEGFVTTFGPISADADGNLTCPIGIQPTQDVTWA